MNQKPDPPRQAPEPRLINMPNALCAARLLATPLLAYLAWIGWAGAFLATAVLLLLIDWLDGKLARWWDQQTEFGARLDSVADAVMYAALALGVWWLRPETLRAEAGWVMAAVAAYGLHLVVGLARFGRPPSYHTRSAKLSWLLVSLAAVLLFLADLVWPLRVAMVAVTLANLESVAITLTLRAWATDVPSLYHAMRARRHP